MQIVVYGRPECPACDWTRKHLDRLDLTYQYLDTDTDKDAARDAKRIMNSENLGTALPLVIVSNSHRSVKWAGFRLEKIRGLRETGDY